MTDKALLVDALLQNRPIFVLAAEIADYLGDGWQLDTDGEVRYPKLRNREGVTFWLDEGQTVITVHASWPLDRHGREARPYFSQYSDYGTASPIINFSVKKTAKQAAGDITRRFLKDFIPLWRKRAAALRAQTTQYEERLALGQKVAQLLHGTVKNPSGDDVRLHFGYRDHGICSVDLHADYINVQVHCTLKELTQLVKLFPVEVQK